MLNQDVLKRVRAAGGRVDRKWWIGIVCILLLAAAGLRIIYKPQPQIERSPLVKTERVTLAPAAEPFTYAGEVRGRYETSLAFQTGGRIVQRNVELGSSVRAGSVLFALDPKDLQEGVNNAAAAVAAARSQLRLAEVNLARYQKLHESGAVSRAELDRARTGYETAAAGLEQAQAGYGTVDNQLGYSQLTAPADGVVAEVNAEEGQVVAAGQKVVTLVRDGDLEVEINVPENRLPALQSASEVSVSFWALTDIQVRGKIREVAPMADKTVRTYKVRVGLIDPAPQIKLGMTAKVAVTPPQGEAAPYIPLAAIYQAGEKPAVWVVKNQTVNLVPVRVGRFADNKVEVLEGLDDGVIIVTAGVHKLREGETVRIAGDVK
ncbi:MAG: efflux RND transporter periplasmic adaptor subunit [Sporomusaceae bacterium]|nr:efflux RND transporter periplasmic adaptor subunit [Sporomusaceae bacterium]